MTNKISRIFGKFASYEFPKPIQALINTIYVCIFKIDMSEFQKPSQYKSLNLLFTRALKLNRSFSDSQDSIISPCDCLITQSSKVSNSQALQIKGMSYSVNELLGESVSQDFYYVNLYLSPRDYHRYHAPCDMSILEIRYFSGRLLSVNKPSLLKNQNVFTQNERVVLVAKDSYGKTMYYVCVGALNVGCMKINFEPRVKTNSTLDSYSITYQTPIEIKKGDEIGMFMMGSTVVLFMQDIDFIGDEQSVKFGDTIGKSI